MQSFHESGWSLTALPTTKLKNQVEITSVILLLLLSIKNFQLNLVGSDYHLLSSGMQRWALMHSPQSAHFHNIQWMLLHAWLWFSEFIRDWRPSDYLPSLPHDWLLAQMCDLPVTQQHSNKASSALCFSATQLRKAWCKSDSFSECIHEIVQDGKSQVTLFHLRSIPMSSDGRCLSSLSPTYRPNINSPCNS